LIITGALAYKFSKKPNQEPVFMPAQVPIPQCEIEDVVAQDRAILENINKRRREIDSIYSAIRIEIPGVRQELTGQLVYEKRTRFRMIIRSTTGLEMDIGSNNTDFWFWSKRMKKPALYYCSYENMRLCPLKAPLNPIWLWELLDINEIDNRYSPIFTYKLNGNIATMGGHFELTKVTLTDPKNSRVIGHYLYDRNWKLIVSSEVLEFQKELPKTIRIVWAEEGATMIWHLSDTKININVPSENWQMPNMKNKQDMAHLPNAR